MIEYNLKLCSYLLYLSRVSCKLVCSYLENKRNKNVNRMRTLLDGVDKE